MARILVVDDEPLIAMLVENWLAELGCEVVGPAASLQQGLDLAHRAELEGAILDVHLGKENCYSIAEVLKDRNVPMIFATGDGGRSIAGFQDAPVLRKPYDFEAVKKALADLLGARPGAN